MSSSQNPPLSSAAVLPGPKNGMTLMTERIIGELDASYSLRIYDIGKSYRKRGMRWRIQKLSRSVASSIRILMWPRRGDEKLYLVLNATSGLLYNLMQVMAAKCRGYTVVAHHHVWSYLSRRDWRMSLILKMMGQRGVHVVACPEMATALETTYGVSLNFAFVTPGIVGFDPAYSSRNREDGTSQSGSRPFTLGMLSNLTMAKGVSEAIGTLGELLDRNFDVTLTLAGPVTDKLAAERIASASHRYGDRIKTLGAIYGQDKLDFFHSIDAFVFPTRYRNESWGIVLNEALMAGVPVITYRRGCTGYLVGDSGGLVIDSDRCFADLAVEQISRWIVEPELYKNAASSAELRGEELRRQAESQLIKFIAGFETNRWPCADQADAEPDSQP